MLRVRLTFPQFRGHRVKPSLSSLHTRPGSHSRGSSDGAADYKFLNVFEDVLGRVFTGCGSRLSVPKKLRHRSQQLPFRLILGGDAALVEQTLVARGRILTAAIRVVQERCRRCLVRQRHGEGPLGQIHGQQVAHRPVDHAARVQIEHDGEVEPTVRGPDEGDVSGPHSIRSLDRELAIEGVRRYGEPMLGLGGGAPLFRGLGPMPSWRISLATRCSPMRCLCLSSASQRRGLS